MPTLPTSSAPGRWRDRPLPLLCLGLLTLLLLVLAAVCLGSVPVPLRDVVAAVTGGEVPRQSYNIIHHVRLPRVAAALMAGSALAVSGAVLQAVLMNPLAGPNIIGVNAGSGLFVLVAAVLLPGRWEVIPLAAFLGALLACGIIYGLAAATGASRITIVLAGVAVSAMPVYTLVSHGRFPYLGYPRRMGREDREKVEEALALTDTARYRHRSVAELSGGQRQKVYFAMALAQDTPLVLLDEPATYLDLRHQLELMELIRLLQSRGKTVAAVLHDLPQALEWADRVAVLEDGKIADQGPPAEVFDRGTLDRVFGLASHRLTVEGKERYFFTKAGGAV